MNENPLVTINILSFNRKGELRNTLTKVFEQDYKNIEVIVVDNASSDGSAEMVRNEFPDVQLIQMQKNIGIAGWNEGFKVAKGEYVLFLDDDAYPCKDAIHKSLIEFENNKIVACITFNLIDLETNKLFFNHWLPSDRSKKLFWPVFVGCAFITKKDRLPKSFVFPENYFVYQHELPMSAEIYINSKKILYTPEIIGYHNFKINLGYLVFNDKMNFKNTLRFINDYIPYCFFTLYYFQIAMFYFSRSIKYKWFKDYLKIFFSTKPLSIRKKISYSYFLSLRKLKVFNYSLLSKFSNL
jgi:GT2 family glycosyltransferase